MTLPLLVLDMDETLISIKYEGFGPIPTPRPYLKEFFQYCRDKFQLAIWTAASEWWFSKVHDLILTPIFQELDWNSPFLFIYHTDVHYTLNNLFYKSTIKPLHKVWNEFPIYGKHNTIMIDDQLDVFRDNEDNGIRIYPYYNDIRDEGLLDMMDVLDEYKKYQETHNRFPGAKILPNKRSLSREYKK